MILDPDLPTIPHTPQTLAALGFYPPVPHPVNTQPLVFLQKIGEPGVLWLGASNLTYNERSQFGGAEIPPRPRKRFYGAARGQI